MYGGGDGRSTRKIVKEAFLHFMRQEHVVGKIARSLVSDVIGMRVPPEGMERSKTTVTATSDVSLFFILVENASKVCLPGCRRVFEWTFCLREFLGCGVACLLVC